MEYRCNYRGSAAYQANYSSVSVLEHNSKINVDTNLFYLALFLVIYNLVLFL